MIHSWFPGCFDRSYALCDINIVIGVEHDSEVQLSVVGRVRAGTWPLTPALSLRK